MSAGDKGCATAPVPELVHYFQRVDLRIPSWVPGRAWAWKKGDLWE